jgi:RNA polymerase sigma-70 factor (ECF subfamily)
MYMSEEHEQLDDAQLVRRVLAGDRAAFEGLYDRHARRVRAVVRNVAENSSTVDDLVQECFLRAYRKLDKLQPPENFGPWLVGIARYVAREKRRKLYRDRHRFVGAQPSDGDGELAEVAQQSSSDDLQSDLKMVLEQVCQLPETERVAMELFFLEDCDAQQTARLVGMSRSGLYALLKRACRNVAKSIERGTTAKE